jgi:hypothetical protein
MTNETRAAYSKFRLDYDAYLNSDISFDEKEDEYIPADHKFNLIATSGSGGIVPDSEDRRYMVFL